MCIYSQLIRNTKYLPNKKNKGVVPAVKDKRVLAVPIGCGFCIECKHAEAKKWQVRLLEDVKHNKDGVFITLTFSNESIRKFEKIINKGKKNKIEGYLLDNKIATIATRRFLETWRKHRKKSVRHWMVTELGHKGTENIHIHGIIWGAEAEEIRKRWHWGFSWIGKHNENGKIKNYVNEKTINYIIKYVKKVDFDHKYYKPIILTSAGIGAGYMKRTDWIQNKYKEGETDETFRTITGHKMGLPIYWRNKIYTDEEREKLWVEKLDKGIRYVLGEKIDVTINHDKYYEAIKWAKAKNEQLGYGSDTGWKQKEYEHQRRIMLTNERIKEKKAFTDEEKKGVQLSKMKEGSPYTADTSGGTTKWEMPRSKEFD